MPTARALLVMGCILMMASLGGAVTTYDIHIEDGAARVNVSFELTCDRDSANCPVSYWKTSWGIPEDATITDIQDTQGEIEDYERVGDEVQFKTNRGPARRREVVTITYRDPDVTAETFKEGISLLRMQLSGFSGERTQVRVTTAEELLAESHSFGFDYSLDEHAANFSGTGPINLHLSIGPDNERYEHFRVFGDGNLSEADDLYWVASAVTGFAPNVNKYPVVVLPDDAYDREVDQWSAGQYRSGGLIFLRKSVVDKDTTAATVLHEVVHAYNEHALRWSRRSRAWFDEGTGKYVEFLIKQKKGVKQPEIFGKRIEWKCGERRRCYYEPRGTPDQLWNYYQSDDRFMYHWTPQDAASATVREFGYAFSELMIRNYIRKHGPDALHPVYDELRGIQTKIENGTRATHRILDAMGTDFTPCLKETRDAFEECLNAVNSMEPSIPEPVGLTRDEKVAITPIERPERQPPKRDDKLVVKNLNRSSAGRTASNIINQIGNAIRGLVDAIMNLFR